MKRALITGGTGFLGTALTKRLKGSEYLPVAIGSQEGDLRKRSTIEKLLKDIQPEIVIHLAANVGGIGKNQKQPAELFYDNAIMGIELMDAAYRNGIEKFVALGTVCAYPKFCPVPFRESDLWSGYPEETNAPYGLAKKMLLVQAQAYRQQYNFNAIYLLPVNMYGPNDNFDLETSHVIPAMIRKFHEAKIQGQKQVTLWGDGSATREFLFVDDAAEGIYLATKHFSGPEPINIGTGNEISIKNLAQSIAKEMEYSGEIVWDTSKPNGQPRRKLDTTQAEKLFGYKSATPIKEGLRKTITWYKEHLRSNIKRAG